MRMTAKAKLVSIVLGVNVLSNVVIFYGIGGSDVIQLLLWLSISLSLSYALTSFAYKKMDDRFKALEIGLLNFQDNEFSSSIKEVGDDEFSQLCQLFNDVSAKLRKEKQNIYQRELLLDKVIESSPIVMFLVDNDGRFVYSNSAARHFLNDGKALEGFDFYQQMAKWAPSLQHAISAQRDSLFGLEHNGEQETWHLSTGRFTLNSHNHRLYLIKQLTKELNRQEVSVWKKVIRVISHELNNSMAPISSVSHSGSLIASELNHKHLSLIFETITERITHLNSFISGYATFAKLPSPLPKAVNWSSFIAKLKTQVAFSFIGDIPTESSWFDASQIEQLMINLIKNAHESGSSPQNVSVKVDRKALQTEIIIADRGMGMSEAVLTNALVPFYSTKQSGTGLGLALCREIVEAHDGRIVLANRKHGGLRVTVSLPNN